MSLLALIFWICLGLVVYTYLGYGILMFVLVKAKGFVYPTLSPVADFEPEVTLVIPCFNEQEVLEEKLKNTLALDYPADKLEVIFITDGSDDGSDRWLSGQEGISVLHQPERRGKAAAENRAMGFVKTPFVVFTDANTLLNTDCLRQLMRHFQRASVGVVSGEKRILAHDKNAAATAGEGFYWTYESFLKKLDSDLYSAIGAAGELIAFRTSLVEDLEEDTILDDFMQAMRITLKGYRNVYEPAAYAMEYASANMHEELKRKVRISAGTWQAMGRLPDAFNPLHQFAVFFMFLSHKVFRWAFVPFCLLILIPLTYYLAWQDPSAYFGLAAGQTVFYLLVIAGAYFENRKVRVKLFFIPYYFFITNWCLCKGFVRFLRGNQKATWEKSRRIGEKLGS